MVAKDWTHRMAFTERRSDSGAGRRRVSRGGRREGDRPARFPHLLVADSYAGVRIPCVRYLTQYGFQVEDAADGQDVLAKIQTAPPHMILVESGLPNAPVATIVRQLREQPDTRMIPIIVMTSDLEWGAEGVADVALVGVLVKPFGLSTMLQEIRRLLREQPPVVGLAPVSITAAEDSVSVVPAQ
jgi:DNA-binding response OmpR family regulator